MADVVSEPEARLNAPQSADLRSSGRSSAVVIVLIWAAQFIYFSIDRLARDPAVEGWRTFAARLIVTAVGILLSFAVLAALRRSRSSSFLKRALLAIALALAAATVHAVVNILVFGAILGPAPGEAFSLESVWAIFPTIVYFFSWIHLAVAVILLSLAYGEDLVHRDRRMAELARQADRARLEAKRYSLDLAEAAERLGAIEQRNAGSGDEPHLWVRKGQERIRLDLAKIDWIAAEGECVRFHSGEQSFLERMSLGSIAEKLSPFGFVRIHRSAVVNIEGIESLSRTHWGPLQVRLRSGAELRVSRSYQPHVRKLVQGNGNPPA